jgi:anti-sigma-K factor RskA
VNNCEQFRELIEAYALGALDAEEHAALDAHLSSGCSDCTKAIEEARWVVSQLAYLAPQQAPSLTLKSRLMQSVRSEASVSRRPVLVFRPRTFWTWVGVAALIIVTLYSGWNALRLQEQARQARNSAAEAERGQQKLQQELALTEREVSILTDPASVRISLLPQNAQTPQLEARWHSQLGIVVTGQQVPGPGGSRVWQLWLIPKTPGAKPMPSLTVRPGPDGKFVLPVFTPPKLIAETKALAITDEPAGGSPQPTTTPRWVGGIS